MPINKKEKYIVKTKSRLTHNRVDADLYKTTLTLNETNDHNRINAHQNCERTSATTLHRQRSETYKYIFHLCIKTRDIYLLLINIKNT